MAIKLPVRPQPALKAQNHHSIIFTSIDPTCSGLISENQLKNLDLCKVVKVGQVSMIRHWGYHDQAIGEDDRGKHAVEYLRELLLMDVLHNHHNDRFSHLINPEKCSTVRMNFFQDL